MHLYVHLPFCKQKCFYCSFAVSIAQEKRISHYLECLFKEQVGVGNIALDTLYYGGGTPSLLNEECLHYLLKRVNEEYQIKALKECTFEMNPEDVNLEKLAILKQWGVSRISVGIQSMNNKILQYLGRNHDKLAVIKAFDILRDCGFDNISGDIIFSIPGQTIDDVRRDVEDVLSLKSEHLSLYSLSIEKNSRLYVKNVSLLDSESRGKHYELVCSMLSDQGFNQYEISNFSRPGKESLHNINCWRGGEYLGLGLSSHSHIKGRRYWNEPNLFTYIEKIDAGQSVVCGQEVLSGADKLMETILFGLRMNEGIVLSELEKACQISLDEKRKHQLNEFVDRKLLIKEGLRIRTTLKGRLVLDEMAARLI